MREDLSTLMAKINFGLKGFRELFSKQGVINTVTDARVAKLEKELAKLREDLYGLAYNISRGIDE